MNQKTLDPFTERNRLKADNDSLAQANKWLLEENARLKAESEVGLLAAVINGDASDEYKKLNAEKTEEIEQLAGQLSATEEALIQVQQESRELRAELESARKVLALGAAWERANTELSEYPVKSAKDRLSFAIIRSREVATLFDLRDGIRAHVKEYGQQIEPFFQKTGVVRGLEALVPLDSPEAREMCEAVERSLEEAMTR